MERQVKVFKFENIEGSQDDSSIFIISLVPLQLKNQEKELWKNPRRSSMRYSKPIKVLFEKETEELITREVEKIESQITNLRPTKVKIYEKDLLVEQSLVMTMIDGKICSILTEQFCQKCYIC
ncbi:hypothetical protein AVEN_252293-1 [Araneus ventricosus]|uniref:Uncharacterized protein n=1 Tax=Araneus ventricosus TaxID=182803 RepID=A0A4Y2DSD1_ARAVE|nr:hypothetical protein AVEN_252293-1 [Araneus ventricosus]